MFAEEPPDSKTILVVEDDEGLKNLLCVILQMHGYTVLAAQHAAEAFWICERYEGTIHLLITDTVMPQMNGHELAEHLASVRPRMEVIFMSGYTANSLLCDGVLASDCIFLQKPFTPFTLLCTVREVLSKANQEKVYKFA